MTSGESRTRVTIDNFIRAETDLYFGRVVRAGGFGKLSHRREMTKIDDQDVVRMNRDTIYSTGVFDLEAAPLTVTLPDAGKRFMSMQIVSQDHFTTEVVYSPGPHRYTKEKVDTRYALIIVRMLANPQDPSDMKSAHALQDSIQVEQAKVGTFEVPDWDPVSQAKVRQALEMLGSLGGKKTMFGARTEVDPVSHLIGTAIGWGGNPPAAARYESVFAPANDGKTAHRITVKDVPVDGFWSISVYNAKGYFEKNDRDAYSLNNLTAKPNPDGSFTIDFGGCREGTANCLPIMPGWNYTVRMYRPRKAILDGSWKFPDASPVG